MVRIIHSNNETIKISYAKQELKKYLQKIGVSSLNALKLIHAREIFRLAVSDFKKGTLFLDQLSSICGYLWGNVFLKKSFEDRQIHSKLGGALYAGGELSYYIRRLYNDRHRRHSGLRSFMLEVMEFYEKIKNSAPGTE